jgi:hypothetical protein
MKLFKAIKYFSFNEECKVFTTKGERADFEGFVTDIPYWLAELPLLKDGGIGVEDGIIYFLVQV